MAVTEAVFRLSFKAGLGDIAGVVVGARTWAPNCEDRATLQTWQESGVLGQRTGGGNPGGVGKGKKETSLLDPISQTLKY